MQAVASRITKGMNQGSLIETCDNSGAKLLKVTSVFGSKTVKGRKPSAGIGDMVLASVKKGTPEMRKQVVFAVIVRQKKVFRRFTGERIKFEDTAAIVVKDEAGNPKGTIIKGAIAKEVGKKWPPLKSLGIIV